MSERLHSNHKKNRVIYKLRGLHKAFNKSATPLLVKSSKSSQINESPRRAYGIVRFQVLTSRKGAFSLLQGKKILYQTYIKEQMILKTRCFLMRIRFNHK